jgi:hypothetical protein
MKEQEIDGKALLDLSAANPLAGNKLKELGLKTMGHRIKLQLSIKGLQTQNLPRMLSAVPGGAGPRSLVFRCTAPSAHPPQVMLRDWEYDRLLSPCLARPIGRSLFPPRARSLPLSLSLSPSPSPSPSPCVCACVRVYVSKERRH